MKKFKGMKKTLIILTIILLSMISFVGIYVKDKNQIKNIMPEYLLSRDLNGYRRIELKVSDEIKETIKYNEAGEVISDEEEETVYRVEEKKVNEDEILTEANYEKTKEIIEKRLNTMQIKDYVVRQDKTNGSIILEIPEDSNTDRVVGQLSLQGKFEIVDNETSEVLMTNDDLKSVQAGYGTTSSGTTAIFININFNKEGTEKFKNITNTYIETTVQSEEVSNEINEETSEETEATEETITKEIAIKIDDTSLLTTHFDEEVSNGILQLSVGSSTSATSEEMRRIFIRSKHYGSFT